MSRTVSEGAAAFSADPAAVYEFVEAFFDALVASGVEHVCISPGSRSTPLAITAARSSALTTWVGLDERASSFFALGLAKFTRRPVALVCTSGTAAANYFPAVVEAHYSRVPLLVLTADRPPELRDWGAGQTIDQPGLYGRYPRWAVEVPIPTAGVDAIRFAAQLGGRAANEAAGFSAGPVHLNWPFREPLAPPRTRSNAKNEIARAPTFSTGRAVSDEGDIALLADFASRYPRGVICAGPMDPSPALRSALLDFSAASRWPILAGPASGLRDGGESGLVLSMGDAFLRSSEFTKNAEPEFVLRIGETPVSKTQRLWLEGCQPAEVWWLDEGQHWGEPSHRATHVVRRGSEDLLQRAASRIAGHGASGKLGEASDSDWLESFRRAERRAHEVLDAEERSGGSISGVMAAKIVARVVTSIEGSALFVSNSMSIRLLDLTLAGSTEGPRVLCSRGASGIDGIPSTALGIAAANSGATVLLTGDLAFLHDLSGLLATKRAEVDLVVVVLDDDGGGIFSFLPVAEQGEAVDFERLFGTPHGIEIEHVSELFGLSYARVTSQSDLDEELRLGTERGGIRIVHVPLDRSANEARFREILGAIVSGLDADLTT